MSHRSLFVCALICAFAALAIPASAASYRETLAAADALVAESSFAQAKLRYIEALALAPDTAAHTWCELWIEDASWHSEASPSIRWREGEAWQKRHLAVYKRLEQPYRDGRVRDDFWQAVLTSRAKYEQFLQLPIAWKHFAAIADDLAAQPPSPEAARRYVAFLQRVLDASLTDLPREFYALRPHLVHGAQVGGTPEDRAWCAWQLAHLGDFHDDRFAKTLPHATEYAARWAAALAAAKSTRWATLARAEEFLWRIGSRWSPDLPPDAPADVPALLSELRDLRPALAGDRDPAAEPLRTRLDWLERNLAEPRLDIVIADTFAPDVPIRFAYGAAGLARLAVTLDRVEPADWLALPDFPNRKAGDSTLHLPTHRILREWTIALPDPARLAWSTQIAEVAPQLPAGLYVLTLRGEKSDGGLQLASQHKFLVSSVRALGVFSSATIGKLFAYRAADGAPLVGATVSNPGIPRSAPRPWSAVTDASGAVAVPALDDQTRSCLLFVDDEPVWFTNTALWRGDQRTRFIDVYTDRPLFRPGETAHWKLIVREHRDGRFVVPTDLADLNLRIMLGDTELVASTPLKLSAAGTAQGEIALPASARPGEARLQLFRDRAPARDVDTDTPLFRVDHFLPPASVAKLEFGGAARSFRPGREIVARVSAGYLSGGPLPHTPVRFTFSADDRFTQNSDDVSQWLAALAREPQSAVTDARGEAETTLALPAFLPEGFKLRLAADLTPEGALPLAAHAGVTLSASGLTLDPLGWTTPRLASPKDTVAFAAVIRDGRGSPVALDLRAQLMELRWSEVWLDAEGRPVSPEKLAEVQQLNEPGRPYPEGWKLVHAAYTENLAAETTLHTRADGRIDVKFKLPHAGVFRLRAFADSEIAAPSSRDFSRGRLFGAWRSSHRPERPQDSHLESLSLVAVDDHTEFLALNPETAAVIAPAEFSPGQPLRVLALAPAGATQAWFSVAGESALLAERATLHGRLALHTFAALPPLLGEAKVDFAYRYTHFADGSHVQTSIRCASAPLTLHLVVKPNTTEARPGQSAQLVVAAQDADGQPAAGAELAVRVADEAVATLVSTDASEPPPQFLALRRTVNTRVVASRNRSYEQDLRPLVDPRIGAIRNPTTPYFEETGLTLLQPFALAIASPSGGPRANSTLAGSRVRTDLRDNASDVSVVTAQYLGSTEPPPPVEVRRHFASTAFWSPDVITDAKGEARVTFNYPDNLTRWRVGVYALGADGSRFGTANAFTRTSLPFQARLQLPRFLIAGDTAEPSAVLVNRTDGDQQAKVSLEVSGPATPLDRSALTLAALAVPAQSEAHGAWPIRATSPGEAQLKLSARTATEADAMSLPLPILEDGLPQHTAAFARLAVDATQTEFSLGLPATLDPARTTVSVQLSPNYATTLLDALPYLIDYPYGCVEQTMNRFLPAVVVRQTLLELGLDGAAIERRILATESPADQKRRAATAGLDQLDEVVRQSLARLEAAQTYQGFGWWPGANTPDLWMTAYVSWGLSLAVDAKVQIPHHLATRATQSLLNLITAANTVDDRLAFAWAALARAPDADLLMRPRSGEPLFTKAFDARDRLSASGRACLALAAKKFGTLAQLHTLVRNLDNGLERADAAGLGETVHWGAAHHYWRASDGAVESTALTLLALLAVDHDSQLIEPAANWLVLNRRSAHWSNTRDTTFAILALNAYLQARGHLDATGEVELLANQTPVQRVKFSPASLLTTPSTISVPLAALRGGANTFTVRRLSGDNPFHAMALASSWARGDDVKPAGHLVEVARRFERQKTEPTLIGTLRLTSESLGPTGTAQAGETVTARVTLSLPNELEYLMIEVPKPAGCEPLNPLSGWDAHLVRVDAEKTPRPAADEGPEGRPLYREEHDDRSAFFLDHLEPGTWELRFGLRAITPGDFRALPVTAEAMYAPEITANSDARRVKIERAP